MDVARPGAPGHGRLDGAGQVAGGAQRAPLRDEARDPRRPPFFAEAPDQVRQLAFGELVDQLRRGHRVVGVHPHVERALAAEAESAGGIVELDGRDAKVEEHGVDPLEPMGAGDVVEVAEVAPNDRGRGFELAQPSSAPCHGRRVTVDGEQAAAGLDRFQQQPGVPAGAQGAVDDDGPGPGLK
jgi:hypothetical protein